MVGGLKIKCIMVGKVPVGWLALQYKLGSGLSHEPGSRGQEVVRLKISKPTLVTHLPSEVLHHKDSIKIKKTT